MKRMSKVMISAVLLMAGGALFAQNNSQGTEQGVRINRRPRQPSVSITTTARQAEELTISGKLSLVKGRIAIQSGGTTYYIAGINRFAGFIDGLKEGADVTLKGFAIKTREEDTMLFRAGKLTINGRDYDLVPEFLSDARENEADETDAEKERQEKYHRSPRQKNFSRQFYFRNHPGMIHRYGRGVNPGMMLRPGLAPQRNRFRQELRQYWELRQEDKKQESTIIPEEKR
jgi:hypothetical protein